MKISSFSELLDIVEQSRKKIWMWVTRFKIKVQNQTFFFWLIFSWVNIASVWSWTYRTAFHIHILDFYDNFWLRTECCYTFRLAKSLRIFLFRICLVLLYSNAMFQLTSHWPRLWFYSTSSTHRIHQIFSSQWTNASLGVSLFAFWHCHSLLVSIETSELFSWLLHFFHGSFPVTCFLVEIILGADRN